MKIGFFSEAGYTGKIERNNPNIRTDSAWVCALDATHHPISLLHQIPDNTYDFGIMIIPKNKEELYNYPLIEQMKRVCNKIGTMQESTYWYWQGGTVQSQLWYHNILQSMDIIFCHNDMDLKYYKGITDVRCELMPTLMITDHVKTYDGERKGVMVGGNWVTAYRGFDSYIISKILSDNITSPTTGRKYLHPDLSVPDGDMEQARKLATRLVSDEEFYIKCSTEAKKNYNKLYTESIWKEKINKIITK